MIYDDWRRAISGFNGLVDSNGGVATRKCRIGRPDVGDLAGTTSWIFNQCFRSNLWYSLILKVLLSTSSDKYVDSKF